MLFDGIKKHLPSLWLINSAIDDWKLFFYNYLGYLLV